MAYFKLLKKQLSFSDKRGFNCKNVVLSVPSITIESCTGGVNIKPKAFYPLFSVNLIGQLEVCSWRLCAGKILSVQMG